jgi:hypothetical protein
MPSTAETKRIGAYTSRGGQIEIVEILERWKEPGALCFRVLSHEGRVYVFRRDEQAGRWDVPEVAR